MQMDIVRIADKIRLMTPNPIMANETIDNFQHKIIVDDVIVKYANLLMNLVKNHTVIS